MATAPAALVFKLGDYSQHHGGLAVIRTLGRFGVRVYGVHEDSGTPAARSAYLSGGFVWHTRGGDGQAPGILAGLEVIAERIGRPFVVVPTDDHAAVFLNEHASELPPALLQPAVRPGTARRLFDKRRCRELALELGFPVPRTTVVRCPALVSDLGDLRYPVMVKRAERVLLPTGKRTYSTAIVDGEPELRRLVETPGDEHEVLLQELIPGGRGDDWLFHAYCDEASDCLVAFTGRKVRSFPAYHGETAFAEATDNPGLRERLSQLLKAIGFVGVCSMDVRFDRRDGSYRLLDLNPRTGACFRMFENVHRVDVVRALYLHLSGREVPKGPQRAGRTYVVEPYDLRAAREYRLGALDRWRSLVGADEHAWLTTGDLLPLGVRTWRQLRLPRRIPAPAPTPRYFTGRAR